MLKRIMSIYWTRQFNAFLLAGVLAAAMNFGSRILFERFVPYLPSLVLAFCVGLVCAFVINRTFVFKASGRSLRHEMGWFALFNTLAFPVTIGSALVLHAYVFGSMMPEHLSKAVSHAIGIMLPVFVNYAAHRFITFKRHDGSPI